MVQCKQCTQFEGMWCYDNQGTKFGSFIENPDEDIICSSFIDKKNETLFRVDEKDEDLMMFLENTL